MPGNPSSTTASRPPTSIPSSSAEVATIPESRPAKSSSSIARRSSGRYPPRYERTRRASGRGRRRRRSAATISTPRRLRVNVQRRLARVDQPSSDRRRLSVGRGPDPCSDVEHWRLPERDGPRAAGRTVIRHGSHVEAGQCGGQALRLPDRRRAADEHGVGAVVGGEAAEPTQQLRHMAPEDASKGVQLVDDDVAKPTEERRPPLVVREHSGVEHLGVREHDRGVLADPRPLLGAGIAVVGATDDPGKVELRQGSELVVGERLGGEEDQTRPRADGGDRGLCHRHLVAAGLARSCARRDHDRPTRPSRGRWPRPDATTTAR